jgi:hypothetical protein
MKNEMCLTEGTRQGSTLQPEQTVFSGGPAWRDALWLGKEFASKFAL